SVVLALRSGGEPGPEVVTGIQHLVASSVGGLQSPDVTVLDDSGRMLSAPNEPGSIAALTSQQLGMQREVEGYLERKAQSLVDGVLGAGDARVKVAAQINFDRVERTTQSVDPDGQVIASEQKAQIIPGPQGGAGSTNTSATYQNSTSMESFTGATGNVKRLSVAVVVDEKQVPQGDSLIFVPRSDAELAQIETLVANAVGLDASRGDRISVASMRFSPPPALPPAPAPTALSVVARYHKEIVALLGLLIAAFVALRVVRTLRAPALGNAPLELAAGTAPDALPALASAEAPQAVNHPMPKRTLTSANTRMRQEVLNSVEDSPEVASRVVRAWLKEA
ncbi:MAG TPA: flagellar M-ring protein FliF C-terminal domain-containing protein, partial [Longimicrobiaceae bacterium]|nr:flagellar M-ring protein FliF C-terminal domain-containing protein [Longimicrobiaceae bacterium]